MSAIRMGVAIIVLLLILLVAILLIARLPLPQPSSFFQPPTNAPTGKASSVPAETPPPQSGDAPRVAVLTDKDQYRRGDGVDIAIRNDADYPVWYAGADGFWNLERLSSDNRWIEVNFSAPLTDALSGAITCIYVVREQSEPSELKARSALHARWPILDICEWPLQPVGVPTAKPQPVAAGTYRIAFVFGLAQRWEPSLTRREYSAPFVVK